MVVEEWRLGLGAESRMFDKQLPVLLAGSRYAVRLPIGDKRTLETFPHEALTRFYRDWYRPDLMAVMAVGDFDADSVAALIRARFATLAGPANPRPRITPPAPMTDTTLVAVATDAEATSSRATLAWRLAEKDPGTIATYRAMLVSDLHDLMLNQRLDELTRRENPPFIGAGAGRSRFVRPVLFASLGVVVPDGGLERGLEAAATEVERVRRHGFTSTELDRAREEFLRGLRTCLRRAGEDALLRAHRRVRLPFPGARPRAGDREGIRARARAASRHHLDRGQRGGRRGERARGAGFSW